MNQAGVRRLVCVTLLGTGASRSNASLIYRRVVLRGLAPMLPDKQAQEDVVRSSELDWTLVRPPRFRSPDSSTATRERSSSTRSCRPRRSPPASRRTGVCAGATVRAHSQPALATR
jgi:uncharacterized protein YbjT (DUF2867 family)